LGVTYDIKPAVLPAFLMPEAFSLVLLEALDWRYLSCGFLMAPPGDRSGCMMCISEESTLTDLECPILFHYPMSTCLEKLRLTFGVYQRSGSRMRFLLSLLGHS